MEDEDVDGGAVDVEGGVNGRGQLADGAGQQVVGRVEDGELGEQRGAPRVLVGARPVVNVHAEVFGQELRRVAVAHDDALQVRLEQPDDVELHLLDQVAHAVLRRPHVVVEREVDRPDARRKYPVVGVVRLVVIGGEPEEVGAEEEEVEDAECGGVVLAMARVDGMASLRRVLRRGGHGLGLLRDEVEQADADE